jgi:hypothetical protein
MDPDPDSDTDLDPDADPDPSIFIIDQQKTIFFKRYSA